MRHGRGIWRGMHRGHGRCGEGAAARLPALRFARHVEFLEQSPGIAIQQADGPAIGLPEQPDGEDFDPHLYAIRIILRSDILRVSFSICKNHMLIICNLLHI